MKREIGTGGQDFESLRINGDFYIDKTDFIREWWKGRDAVTLITRPRRFGKTLNMSALNCFFSNRYRNRGELFEGLKVWEDSAMREQQGKWPVIFLSFAGIKGTTYESSMVQMKKLLVQLFSSFPELYETDRLDRNERFALDQITEKMSDDDAAFSIHLLSMLLKKIYEKKVLIFLDEYDTPLQEAYLNGYWDRLVAFTRTMFNNAFKTNLALERGMMTGITRVSKESIFSDLNNLVVITTTTSRYMTAFGFTEEEVYRALDEQGYGEKDKTDVKEWYDGFTFGRATDIYNPWSIVNYLKMGELGVYWANTSSNGLVGTLLRRGDPGIKQQFEALIHGETIEVSFDEQIIFNQLDHDRDAIWSLLLASGYLKIANGQRMSESGLLWLRPVYPLALTNLEVRIMFTRLIQEWFKEGDGLTPFVRAMLQGNARDMDRYLNRIALQTFSSFDAGNHPSGAEPERFYHGFVLGLMVDQAQHYMVKSNRESGYGRYDVIMEPRDLSRPAVILEFKVFDKEEGEKTLEDTAHKALIQIEKKRYDAELRDRGIPEERILKYGIAFRGKKCKVMAKMPIG